MLSQTFLCSAASELDILDLVIQDSEYYVFEFLYDRTMALLTYDAICWTLEDVSSM
jgi:hypothetical protein